MTKKIDTVETIKEYQLRGGIIEQLPPHTDWEIENHVIRIKGESMGNGCYQVGRKIGG